MVQLQCDNRNDLIVHSLFKYIIDVYLARTQKIICSNVTTRKYVTYSMSTAAVTIIIMAVSLQNIILK